MQLVAIATIDKMIKIWDYESNSFVLEMKHQDSPPDSISFSPDGSKLLCLCDLSFSLWDLNTGECLNIFSDHPKRIRSVTFSNDGDRIVSLSCIGLVKIWNPHTYEVLNTFYFDTDITDVICINSDGDKIAIERDGIIKIYNTETGICFSEIISGYTNCITILDFSPDGTKILFVTCRNVINVYNVETCECLLKLKKAAMYTDLFKFSSDGNRLVLLQFNFFTINVYDINTGDCIKSLVNERYLLSNIITNFDGSIVLSVSSKNTIKVWDVSSGECIHSLFCDTHICAIASSSGPIGSYI